MSIDNININVKDRLYELLKEHLSDLLMRTTKTSFDKSWIKDINSLLPLAIKILFDKNEELKAKILELETAKVDFETRIAELEAKAALEAAK